MNNSFEVTSCFITILNDIDTPSFEIELITYAFLVTAYVEQFLCYMFLGLFPGTIWDPVRSHVQQEDEERRRKKKGEVGLVSI